MFQKMITPTNGSSGNSTFELIWTNLSPNTNMSAMTIDSTTSGWENGKSIDDYDGFIVLTKNTVTAGYASQGYGFSYIPNYDVSSIASEGEGYYGNIFAPSLKFNLTRYGSVVGRVFQISNGGFSMETNYVGATMCIPLYIWGVKGKIPIN